MSSATIGLIPRMRAPVLKIIQPLTIAIIIVRKWPQVCRWKKQDHLELGIGQNSIYCQAPDPEVLTAEHVPPEVVWVLLYFFYLNKYVPLSAKQKDAFCGKPLPQLCEMNNLWSSVGLDEPQS